MKCPVCGCPNDKVLDTRPIDDDRSIRRRRECLNCQHRFTSYETLEKSILIVVKRDNTREAFSREKLINGIQKACRKRPVSMRQITSIVEEIENDLHNGLRMEISTIEIGERILTKLLDIDEVAYIRFASVYREFHDLNSFVTELDRIKKLKETEKANNKA